LTEDQIGWIGRVEIHNEFGSMSEFGSEDPGSFFISALITVQQTRYNSLAGMMLVVNLGVKDFREFKFWLIINNDWLGWGLNSIGNLIWSCWFQHRDVKYWVYGMETVRKSEGDGMGARECKDFVQTKEFIG